MKTKTNLITKLGIVAGLAGAIYFASPSYSLAQDDTIFVNDDADYSISDDGTDMSIEEKNGIFGKYVENGFFGFSDAEEIVSKLKDSPNYEKEIQTLRLEEKSLMDNASFAEGKIYAMQDFYNDKAVLNMISVQRDILENKVLLYYPGLAENPSKRGFVYNADSAIDEMPLKEFINTIQRTGEILKNYSEKELLVPFYNRNLTLKDIVSFYEILLKLEKADYASEKKGEYTEEVKKLKEQTNSAENRLRELMEKVSELEQMSFVSKSACISELENYITLKETRKGIAKITDFSDYAYTATFGLTTTNEKKFSEISFEDSQNSAIYGLKHCISSNIASENNIEFEKLKNPQKGKFPFWAGALAGFLIPIGRNLVLKRYLKGSETEGIDYFISFFGGTLNGLIGMVLDTFNPWIFPLRIAATPLIHPILKLLGTNTGEVIEKLME